MICNGDVTGYDDGVEKMVHPENRKQSIQNVSVIARNEAIHAPENWIAMSSTTETGELLTMTKPKNLDGFMIGRASFGNPWCFLLGNHEPTLGEILETMKLHGDLLWQWKNRKGMMEARKHLVQYLHGFP